MNCPRCATAMIEMSNHDVKVDVCQNSCGGIWFDWLELKKMDEEHESDESFISQLSGNSHKPAIEDERVNCPTCDDNQVMMRRFWSIKKGVEIDECPKCGGFWLDAGELTHIYSQYETEDDRKNAAAEVFDDMFGSDLAKLREESLKDNKKYRRLARALKFICPSYYIPGKQDWGAF